MFEHGIFSASAGVFSDICGAQTCDKSNTLWEGDIKFQNWKTDDTTTDVCWLHTKKLRYIMLFYTVMQAFFSRKEQFPPHLICIDQPYMDIPLKIKWNTL